MKLATFTFEGVTRIGKILDDKVLDLTQVLPDLPKDMTSLLKLGEGALNQVRDARSGHPGQLISLSSVRLEAPVPNPQKYLGIGLNYEDHAEEARKAGTAEVSCFSPIVHLRLWSASNFSRACSV